MAEILVDGISKRFGTVAAVSDLSLAIADGEFFVLLGPTGAGKTTTLRLIAGLEKPDSGSISIAGRPVDGREPAARDIAFVFQQFALYPHLSVFDNLAFPLRSPARRIPEDKIAHAIRSDTVLTSLDAGSADDGAAFGEFLADTSAGSPEEHLLRHDARNRLRLSLAALGAREREVLELRFGLRNSHGQTLQEIADRLGVTRERVRQIEQRALARLRREQGAVSDENGVAA